MCVHVYVFVSMYVQMILMALPPTLKTLHSKTINHIYYIVSKLFLYSPKLKKLKKEQNKKLYSKSKNKILAKKKRLKIPTTKKIQFTSSHDGIITLKI